MASSDTTRLALASLTRDAQGALTTVARHGGAVDTAQYSDFKYGDGYAATQYGAALAAVVLQHLGTERPLHVTSSGYGFVPPAAHALVEPFTATARTLGAEVHPFRVLRSTVSNGDYAAMTLDQRRQAMSAHALSVHDHDLTGAVVVALDDVRVTGVHEQAMDECLWAAGAAQVHHAYIVDAWDVRQAPAVEAALNAASVADDAALVALTRSAHFVPNARFCKRVLSMGAPQMRAFLSAAPAWVGEWVASAAVMDGLDRYPAYRGGMEVLRAVRARMVASSSR